MSSAALASTPLDPSRAPRITVIGCGVIGLSVAIQLQKHGAQVTIRSVATPLTSPTDPCYTSDKAGAHWFSFATSTEVRKQALDELAFYGLMGLAVTEPSSGVQIVDGHALFEPTSTGSAAATKPALPWFTQIVPRFREWTPADLAAHSTQAGVQYARGFSYQTAMIHAPHYLRWLLSKFLEGGGVLRAGPQERLANLSEAWTNLGAEPTPDAVINCCGLGVSSLADVRDPASKGEPTVFPDRGQVIIVRCPQITDIWRVPADLPTYILPRGDGTVILGGTHQYKDGNVGHDSTVAAAILARCARVLPLLRDPSAYTVLAHSAGLRPSRPDNNQRIEIDESFASASNKKTPLVVHAYGHGGDGFQSSWGTAIVVAHLIQQARPGLFKSTFQQQFSQQRTAVLKRAVSKELYAKL